MQQSYRSFVCFAFCYIAYIGAVKEPTQVFKLCILLLNSFDYVRHRRRLGELEGLHYVGWDI